MRRKCDQADQAGRHREFAAFLAISLRLSGESLAARLTPPFSPPSLPKATAAGFFAGWADGDGAACPVTCWTMA